MTDWLSPGASDCAAGLETYIEEHLAAAVDTIRRCENAEQVSLLGSCGGGLLATPYAALHPERIANLVTFATPFDAVPPVDSFTAAGVCRACGNVPAWMVYSVMNMRVPSTAQLPEFLARELAETGLRDLESSPQPELVVATRRWLESDVPLAGQVFLGAVCFFVLREAAGSATGILAMPAFDAVPGH